MLPVQGHIYSRQAFKRFLRPTALVLNATQEVNANAEAKTPRVQAAPIKALENTLGQRLLVRGKQVRATPAGQSLLAHVKQVRMLAGFAWGQCARQNFAPGVARAPCPSPGPVQRVSQRRAAKLSASTQATMSSMAAKMVAVLFMWNRPMWKDNN